MSDRPVFKKKAAPALLVFALATAAGQAGGVEDSETMKRLWTERDELLGKIASGTDYEASVKRWKELMVEHDKITSASTRARELQLADGANKAAELQARLKIRDEYHKTADYDASWRCTFSPDPSHPLPSTEGRFP